MFGKYVVLIKEASELLANAKVERKVNGTKELKVKTESEAQELVKEKIKESYHVDDHKVKVSYSKTNLETNTYEQRFWVVEGEAIVKISLFRKKSWSFIYYVNADQGKISVMRSKKKNVHK